MGKKKVAIFLCGTTGSGKTTFRKTLPKSYTIINNDELKLPSTEFNDLIKKTIESGKSFIYDGTCRDRKNMLQRMKSAKDHKYKVVFIALYVSLKVSLERVTKRLEHQVPTEVVEDIYQHLTKNIGEYLKVDFIDEVYLYDNEIETRLIYHKKNGNLEFKSPKSEFYIEI